MREEIKTIDGEWYSSPCIIKPSSPPTLFQSTRRMNKPVHATQRQTAQTAKNKKHIICTLVVVVKRERDRAGRQRERHRDEVTPSPTILIPPATLVDAKALTLPSSYSSADHRLLCPPCDLLSSLAWQEIWIYPLFRYSDRFAYSDSSSMQQSSVEFDFECVYQWNLSDLQRYYSQQMYHLENPLMIGWVERRHWMMGSSYLRSLRIPAWDIPSWLEQEWRRGQGEGEKKEAMMWKW
jgi:hypothetical protein